LEKLIIIEGIDGSGKSTLIQLLYKELYFDYLFNYSYPKEATEKENLAYTKGEYKSSIRIFKELLARDLRIVCDRFHLGEYAYGPIKRGYKTETLDSRIKQIEEFMIKNIDRRNIRLILLTALPNIVLSRLAKKKDLKAEYVLQETDLLFINYRYAIYRSLLPYLQISTDKVTPIEVLKKALKFINTEVK